MRSLLPGIAVRLKNYRLDGNNVEEEMEGPETEGREEDEEQRAELEAETSPEGRNPCSPNNESQGNDWQTTGHRAD